MSRPGTPPLLRVVRGEPTAEELAAVVVVLAAVAARAALEGVADARAARPRPAWGDPARAARRPLRPGPDGWRRSALPR